MVSCHIPFNQPNASFWQDEYLNHGQPKWIKMRVTDCSREAKEYQSLHPDAIWGILDGHVADQKLPPAVTVPWQWELAYLVRIGLDPWLSGFRPPQALRSESKERQRVNIEKQGQGLNQ